MDCSCKTCQSFCKHKPGWFAFGQLEKVATFLGVCLPTLFRRYLKVESFVDRLELAGVVDEKRYFVLTPKFRNGHCVFFQNGHCSIHPVKPMECATTSCQESNSATIKGQVATTWMSSIAQKQVQDLR